MTRRTSTPMDKGQGTLKPMAGKTTRATLSSGRQEPDILAGDTSCEHAEQCPTNNDATVSAPEPAASGAPAPLCPEAHAFAMLLAQAMYAHILRTRQEAGQPVPPQPADQLLGAPAKGSSSPQPAGVVDRAPAGAEGDGGGRASVSMTSTVNQHSSPKAGSHEILTIGR